MKRYRYFSLLVIMFFNSCSGVATPNATIPSPTTTPPPAFTSEPTFIPTSDPKEALLHYGLIAYTSTKDGDEDIFTMNADGSNQTNITNNPARDILPAWSPDGEKIAFVSTRTNDEPRVFSMNPDGSNVTQLTEGTGHGFFFVWSPNGKKIAYVTYSDDPNIYTGELVVIDADGKNKTVLTNKIEYDYDNFIFGWSPDSQYLVYRLVEGENSPGLYIAKADGSKQIEWPDLSYMDHIHWLDNKSFIAYSQFWWDRGKGQKLIQILSTDGSRTEFPVFESTIVAVFDKTYVIREQDGLKWFTLTSPPKLLSSYNSYLRDDFVDMGFYISPNKKLAFVIAIYQNTSNSSSSFFLMNDDGAVIQQIGAPYYDELQLLRIGWSPDSKYVTKTITNHTLTPDGHKTITETGDIYLFDIQQALKDPSLQPIRLTTDGATKSWGPIWQPIP